MTGSGAPRRPRVAVVGSVNADFVLRAARRPGPGETVGEAVLELHGGGKGANQATAAALCGVAVELVARVGDDAQGRDRVAGLAADGVGTSHIALTPGVATGTAMIVVTPDGENSILVAPGANSLLCSADLDGCRQLLGSAAVVLVQLEIPIATAERAVELAGAGSIVVCNAAPPERLSPRALGRLDVLVANEHEAAQLAGVTVSDTTTARAAGRALLGLGPRAAVVTLGAGGAVAVTAAGEELLAAPRVEVLDTTGAGDAFCGALAGRLALGDEFRAAAAFAVRAGSATTRHRGARPHLPD